MNFFIEDKDSRLVRRLKIGYLVPIALLAMFPVVMLIEARDALRSLGQEIKEAWG